MIITLQTKNQFYVFHMRNQLVFDVFDINTVECE